MWTLGVTAFSVKTPGEIATQSKSKKKEGGHWTNMYGEGQN